MMRRLPVPYLLVIGVLAGVLLVALFGADHTPVGINGPTRPADPVPTSVGAP